MAYCSPDDIGKMIPANELVQLTSEVGSDVDTSVVTDAIAAADAEIDGYLLVRYQLPLAAVPARVKALSVDMTIQRLFNRRGSVNEARRLAYNNAVQFLQSVAKGLAVIEGADGIEPAGQVEDVVEVTSQPRIFDRDTLKGW